MFPSRSFDSRFLGYILLGILGFSQLIQAAGEDDLGLFHFVTRPDIKAPRWNIEVYDEALLSPGYWFLAPYKALRQPIEGVRDGWIGPTIYTQDGELVWSGASKFRNRNVEDFKISNVRGEDVMTLMHQGDHAGYILNNDFKIREKVKEVDNDGDINTHEFNFVEDGTEAIVIKTDFLHATREMSKAIEYDGVCYNMSFDKFEVLDTQTWETKFSWSSYDHIGLDESTLDYQPPEKRCSGGWDYVHCNSVDKTPDGNYLFSCRHTDTLYLIDGQTGHIIWRLGGRKSDFHLGENVRFSRQHNVRWRGGRNNKMAVSILDNARGMDHQAPTYSMSRGLRLVLNLETMRADVDLQIDHPEGPGSYAPRRGNYQVLPNQNIFMDWSEKSLQSEHALSGRLLMEAKLKAEWLGTYRSYKFPFVGKPADPPDVVAIAETHDRPTTLVYASWNGATEVAWWNTYVTNSTGHNRTLIGTTRKTGFETQIAYSSFAEYVVVEGIDKDFNVLGESRIHRTQIADAANATMIYEEMNAGKQAVIEDGYDDEDDFSIAALMGAVVALGVVALLGFSVIMALRWKGIAPTFKRFEYQEVEQDIDAKSSSSEKASLHRRNRSVYDES